MDKAMDPVRAQGAVNQILEYLAVRIASGEKIEIRRFGSFSIRLRAARVARNPRTGEILNLSAVKVCYFKPGKGPDSVLPFCFRYPKYHFHQKIFAFIRDKIICD